VIQVLSHNCSYRPRAEGFVSSQVVQVIGSNPHTPLFASASQLTRLIHFIPVNGVGPFPSALLFRWQWRLMMGQGIQMREEVGKASRLP
jgi:hypothetical protein